MLFEVTELDKQIYRDRLADFLPSRIIDIHTHVWLESFVAADDKASRGPTWPSRVARQNSIEELQETYRLMFPGKQVTPAIFSTARPGVPFAQVNGYISQVARQHRVPAFLLCRPEWSAAELTGYVRDGGFLGLKPYLNFAPPHIPSKDITIFDFLPHHQLQAADAHGWVVILHVPRPLRLRDPLNLEQMLEIEFRYPNAKLVIAHIGRAYCLEDVSDAFEVLRPAQRMVFDFSAHTNAEVMALCLQAVGPRRVVFGSDLPILRMRMRRICEDGRYVNLVPPGLYGDVSGDREMREVSAEEGRQLTFFMYEELLAFRRAAEACKLTACDVEDVFYNNAAKLLALPPIDEIARR
jgi:predicted TIM-barrel fold metal-dependent hydrolase